MKWRSATNRRRRRERFDRKIDLQCDMTIYLVVYSEMDYLFERIFGPRPQT